MRARCDDAGATTHVRRAGARGVSAHLSLSAHIGRVARLRLAVVGAVGRHGGQRAVRLGGGVEVVPSIPCPGGDSCCG